MLRRGITGAKTSGTPVSDVKSGNVTSKTSRTSSSTARQENSLPFAAREEPKSRLSASLAGLVPTSEADPEDNSPVVEQEEPAPLKVETNILPGEPQEFISGEAKAKLPGGKLAFDLEKELVEKDIADLMKTRKITCKSLVELCTLREGKAPKSGTNKEALVYQARKLLGVVEEIPPSPGKSPKSASSPEEIEAKIRDEQDVTVTELRTLCDHLKIDYKKSETKAKLLEYACTYFDMEPPVSAKKAKTCDQLRKELRELGVTFEPKANKAELTALLKQHTEGV